MGNFSWFLPALLFLPIQDDWTDIDLFNDSSQKATSNGTEFQVDQNGTRNTTVNVVLAETGQLDIATVILTSAVLLVLILATVIGNVFVIAAILLERNLQSVGNYLVLSLAVADLLVACLVMPLGAVYEVSQEWSLGAELCDIWTSCDVLCCTASILHLLAIALDRFWAVTNVDYIRQRNSRRVCIMIMLVWGVAFLVSIAPIVGWKDADYARRVKEEMKCMVSQDAAYQIFATCSSFYVPLILILLLYWRIFQVARKRIRHKPGSRSRIAASSSGPRGRVVAQLAAEMTVMTSSSVISSDCITNGLGRQETPLVPKRRPKESLESKRERKAAKTLAIITGIFVACWLPFFVVAIMMPLCEGCEISDYIFSVFLWLGYANSMLNPIIYTIFSPDFRSAFKRMFTRCYSKR